MRQTALAIAAALGAAASGCEKPAQKPANPPQQAAAPPAAPAENAAPAAAPAAQPAPPPENPAKQSLNQRTITTIVDAQKALAENPKLIVKEKNEFKATDPITYVSKGYFAGVSTATISALKHEIELMKAMDEKNQYPSFEVFQDVLKRNRVTLNGLYRWQVYGYDSKDGAIVILEDPDKKKAEYEKAGLDPANAP
jgi:hypothetical protein